MCDYITTIVGQLMFAKGCLNSKTFMTMILSTTSQLKRKPFSKELGSDGTTESTKHVSTSTQELPRIPHS